MSLYGSWKDCVITIATDDDLSAEVDLGRDYEYLQVVMPALTAATVGVQVAEKSAGTFNALGTNSPTTVSTSGSKSTVLLLGGYQFIKLATSAGQAANRTFRVRGSRV